jgi:glyoxylase-like metal-dependent hydrolase (beta-lactamase superfamily II)
MPSQDLPAELELFDLMHTGSPRVVGAWLVGDVIVDPGPSSCLAALLAGLGEREPRVIALTHVHLDHAGSTGTLLRRFPRAEVWVHERGATHMVDPSRLLDSAARLYGSAMGSLWGEVAPVPGDRVRVLRGGETLGGFRVLYTPGHASHHVSYLHEPSGTAFTGDVAGVRIGSGPVLAPTPPPDIDLRAWRASLDELEALAPTRLALTHYGAHEDVRAHIEALREELGRVELSAAELGRAAFAAQIRGRIERHADTHEAESYARASSPEQNFDGLSRYLQKVRERVS